MITSWFEATFPDGYGVAVMWTAAALLVLVALLVFARIVRALRSGTFVAGGRNRKPRLAVMDATPIDAKRRLVLVRRDDVEHLILIGGANDLVVEQGITLVERGTRAAPQPGLDFSEPAAPQPRAAPSQPAYAPAPRPEPQKTPRPVTQVRDIVPVPLSPATPAPQVAAPQVAAQRAPAVPARAASPAPETQPPVARPRTETGAPPQPISSAGRAPEAPRPVYSPPPRPAAEIMPPPRAAAAMTIPSAPISRPPESPRGSGLSAPTIAPVRRPLPAPAASQANGSRPAPDTADAALMRELELGLDTGKPEVPEESDISLDDEMAKLLGELSREKR